MVDVIPTKACASAVSTANLTKPSSDLNRLTENAADIQAFDVFPAETQENSVHYNAYAAKYDRFQDMSGYNDPYEMVRIAIEKLGQPGQLLAATDARILDFGCGTGLMGVELQKVGYTNISGLDGSSEMLRIANTKGIY